MNVKFIYNEIKYNLQNACFYIFQNTLNIFTMTFSWIRLENNTYARHNYYVLAKLDRIWILHVWAYFKCPVFGRWFGFGPVTKPPIDNFSAIWIGDILVTIFFLSFWIQWVFGYRTGLVTEWSVNRMFTWN